MDGENSKIKQNEILHKIYYDVKNPNSYSSAQKLYGEAKKYDPSITLNEVKKWLTSQFTYTLHKNARKNFSKNKIIVKHCDEQWESDLIDYQMYSRQNKGYKYILVAIDCLSKFGFAVCIKNKTGTEIIKGFKKIFKSGRKCFKLRTDQGKEFTAGNVKEFFKTNDVHHFTSSNNSLTKCAIAERFILTIKKKLHKIMTAKGTRTYYNILDQVINTYNSTKHNSIQLMPKSVTDETESEAFYNLYGTTNYRSLFKVYKSKFGIGDMVRKRYLNSPLDKSYHPNFSDTVYKVTHIIKGSKKNFYKLATLNNKALKGRFYEEDLQKVTENLYRIDKVIKTRTKNGKKEYFVSWIGFGPEFNSWTSDIVRLNGGEKQS